LANSNLLASGNKPRENKIDLISKNNPVDLIGNDKISVYPNPVTNNQFTIQFNSLDAGNYSIQIKTNHKTRPHCKQRKSIADYETSCYRCQRDLYGKSN